MTDMNQLETPVAVVDLDKLEQNIHRLQGYLDAHAIENWPHIKTHKIPAIAQKQIAAGAVGITCQKLGEAEIMAQSGMKDIFLPYNIIGPSKLARLMRLARQIKICVTADSSFVVAGLSEAARQNNVILPVMVEFDTGMARCGVQTPQEAADLACLIDRQSHLVFEGLMTYPFNEQTLLFVQQTKILLDLERIPVRHVSVGGTPQMWHAHKHPYVTQYRAGTFVYGDRHTLGSGAMTLEQSAFSVITTVVSRPTPDRGIIDGGSKTFSSDLSGFEDYGLVLEYPQARIYKLSEEHGFVDFSGCPEKPGIGDRITVLPNHCCSVTNLFNEIVAVRDGVVDTIWSVAARGAVQ